MIKSRIAKIAGLTIGMTLALGSTAGAVTIAELQAQINALMAQLATLQGTTTTTSAAITSNLTIGSTGSQVVTLQSALVSQGHLVMPAGVAMGYFGSLTKAAVMKWQAANGVSATGYFGTLSKAKFNATVSVGVTGTGSGTTVGSGTVVVGTITTPGVEGTITVSLNPSPSSGTKLYEADGKRGVLGIKLEAKTSDMRVERVKIDLDATTSGNADNDLYRKISGMIYVMDGSTVLASSALNTSTVVKDGSDYFITLSGMSFVVPKDATKVLTVALDAMSTWDSGFDNDSWTLGVPVNGLRAIDGAAINQYGPATAFTRSFDSAGALVDSATMAVSLNSSTQETQQVICELNSDNDECDTLEIAKFDFKAEKDNVTITDLVVDLVRGGAQIATATTAYIYDGSTLVGSASVAGTSGTVSGATFSDIDWVVSKDTTKTLAFKVDIRDASVQADTYAADIDTADVTAENAAGASITESGTAQGKTFTIRKVGPQVTLVSKSITTSGVPQGNPAAGLTSTSTLSATFNVKIKALGGDLLLATVASGTPTFASSTTSFKVYRNGTYDSTVGSYATSSSYSIPGTCVSEGTESCKLSEGAEITIPVTFNILGRLGPGKAGDAAIGTPLTVISSYSVQMEGVQWVAKNAASATTTTFMSGLAEWRTADVSFP
ncbi:MAG: hypothetical protein A3B16_00320 [Candidatus Zambryskibacteria bacterium RIFCSPLOWO2_01_FULL_45_43]|uniref:Peptidoglycan binding-like domain-containing protein n=1 Tax=Candidatus Zambryskibacteria bacterium RIFCSPLOWO2_01_FULL_45_43 TaxID=1802762 RepID=A0A1G2UA92_9BACT|nr:MAG: hypothetical protein A3B16_00320 [Candidatus Zambryskibacteria bacterium RIFCSPLOWO2_01_FULL_45_43]